VALKFEELRVLQVAEQVADGLWRQVMQWEVFARDTVGKQMTRAADSIGANIAEAYGRYHYGEKLQFLYYARGSLFESKYWLNRASARHLLPSADAADYTMQLTDLARQLNSFAADLKTQRHRGSAQPKAVRETGAEYANDQAFPLFSTEDLESLATDANT
jgi:four helix bundle protein